MAKFIKLTCKTGRPVIINVSYIKFVDVSSEGVVFINFSEEDYHEVKEPIEVVMELL
jgi:hypothetical protein